MGFKDIVIVPSENESEILDIVDRKNIIMSPSHCKGINFESFRMIVGNRNFPETYGYTHEFLERSSIFYLSTPKEPRNAELEARIQKLKTEQANEEYKNMTKNLGSEGKKTFSVQQDVKSASAQITAVINFVLSVGGSFLFAYKAVEYALPEQNIPAQVLMGILTSMAVALADLYFLLRTI